MSKRVTEWVPTLDKPASHHFLSGNFTSTLRPFLDTIRHISDSSVPKVFARAERTLQKAKERKKKDASDPVIAKMHVDVLAAIMKYCEEDSNPAFYKALNQAHRTRDQSIMKQFEPFVWLLMNSLHVLPAYGKPTVFRGVKLDLSKEYWEKRVVTWDGFTSTTKKQKVLETEQFCGQSGERTLFVITITQSQARDISHFSPLEEGEVLLPPGSRFEVTSEPANLGHGLHIIHLQELQSDAWILDMSKEVVNNLQQMLQDNSAQNRQSEASRWSILEWQASPWSTRQWQVFPKPCGQLLPPHGRGSHFQIIGFSMRGCSAPCDQVCCSEFLGNFFDVGEPGFSLKPPCASKAIEFRTARAAFEATKAWKHEHEHEHEFDSLDGGTEATKKIEALQEDFRSDVAYGGFGSDWCAMLAVLKAKFTSHCDAQGALMRTGSAFLLGYNSEHDEDQTWSCTADGEGKNWLGLQLMLLRDQMLGRDVWTPWLMYNIDMATGDLWQGSVWQDCVRMATEELEKHLMLQD